MENFDQYYRSYKYMQKHLDADFTANYLNANMVDNDKGDDILSGKFHEKLIDMEWVAAIEEALPYIEKAIEEKRRFIIENDEIYRIEKVKVINKDSVKHLVQHTNFIDDVDEDGSVTPKRLLTIEREDSFETYENRFLITLIENALNFVSDKYRKMVNVPTSTFTMVKMDRDLDMNDQHITFKMEYSNEVKETHASMLDIEDYKGLSDFDRVKRIRQKLNSFLNTDVMKVLKDCVRIKPPINRTNLMTKNPNYKAVLDLFIFLGAYTKDGYEIVDREFSGEMNKEVQEAVYISQGFQHFMISIATKPKLKQLLEERYERYCESQGKSEENDSDIDAIIEKVRKEELKIRLQEIRERDGIIQDQKTEIAVLKRKIEMREKTIESLKSKIEVLENKVHDLEHELRIIKAELLEAKERIAALEAKVAELEAIKAQLELKITELEVKIAELEKNKAQLESKVAELEKTVETQKVKIASQAATIEGLESELAAAKAKISDLTKTLAARDSLIAKQMAEIDALSNNVAQLTADLATEKQEHVADVEAANAAAIAKEEELVKRFDDEKLSLENNHKIEMEQLEKDHQAAMDKFNKQKETEIVRIQKNADARVKAAQKEAEKKAKEQIKSEVGKAKAEAKAAEKKANATALMYKKELKFDRGNDGLYQYDFAFGALGLQALKATTFASAGMNMSALPDISSMQCLYIVRDNKKVTVYNGTQKTLSVLKNFRGTTDFDVCKELVKAQLKVADPSCVYISYKTVDKNYVSNLAGFLKNEVQFGVTRTFHNKTQKSGKSSIGIYYYKK